MRGVLELVREKSGWGTRKLPTGTALGVAFQFATAATSPRSPRSASTRRTSVKVQQGVGRRRHRQPDHQPEHAENQVQGAVIEGLSHLMAWEITIESGRAVQSNFHQYQLVRMAQAPPEIEVHFLQDGQPADRPRRAGAAAGAPALANAIFAATGKRIRSLPLAKHGYSWA